jgi:hypothetical protein
MIHVVPDDPGGRLSRRWSVVIVVASSGAAVVLAVGGLLSWLKAVLVVGLLWWTLAYRFGVPSAVRSLDGAVTRLERVQQRLREMSTVRKVGVLAGALVLIVVAVSLT